MRKGLVFLYSFYILKIIFWPCHMACGILVPLLEIELGPSTVKVQSPKHWTTREFPIYFKKLVKEVLSSLAILSASHLFNYNTFNLACFIISGYSNMIFHGKNYGTGKGNSWGLFTVLQLLGCLGMPLSLPIQRFPNL